VLVGPPGVGKTSVGRLVAEHLGLEFRDTDHDVERATGATVAEYFRVRERTAVADALGQHPGVLTLGGGAVMDPRTRADLSGHTVVFLDVGLAEAMRRLGMNRQRPLLAGSVVAVRQEWSRLYRERRPLYEEVATLVVTTDGRTPEQVAAEITQSVLALKGER
jgi:shikimate kinase